MRIIHGRQMGKGGRNVRTTLQSIDKCRRSGELNDQMARPRLGTGRGHAAPSITRSRCFDHHLKTSIGDLHGKLGLRATPLP